MSRVNVNATHRFVSSFSFKNTEISEAKLADAIAEMAEKNGMSANDVAYVFPYILRMLKSDSEWSK